MFVSKWKICQFSDGKFGVRRRYLFWYQYARTDGKIASNLSDEDWFILRNCKMTETQAKDVLKKLEDTLENVVDVSQDKLTPKNPEQ